MLFVADASAILAYLRGESGGEKVRRLLADASNEALMHSVNLCEFYYDVLRASGVSKAVEVINDVIRDGVHPCVDCSQVFWTDAGNLKVAPGKLSLADCFAIALARREDCELLTVDHHEMDKLVGTGIVKLRFVR